MSATATEFLPATLDIEVRGEVIASNAAEFREMVRAALATINRTPATDAEFGEAVLAVKSLTDAERAVRSAKSKALADAGALHALFETLDETSDEIRQARLDLEKQIAARKDEVRAGYIEEALAEIADVSPLLARRAFTGELEAALKGKRTLDSMAKALDVAVKTINARLAKSRTILDQFRQAHGSDLIMDRADLELRSAEAVEAELRRRLESKVAREEADRLRSEAATAKAQLIATQAPATVKLPDAPKIGSLPTGPSPLAEWVGFQSAVMAAFLPLKEAKGKLRHPENQARAQQFAVAVNAAWLAAKGGAA